MKILVICDRDWTHPQGGGAGINLRKQVDYWLEWGHQVDILTVSYDGAKASELHDGLRIERHGSTFTVYFAIASRLMRGAAKSADVVLEVVNGVPWMSHFITGKPTVAMVHHVCQQQYDLEFRGIPRYFGKFLEGRLMPFAYRNIRFITVSESSKQDLVRLGISAEHVSVVHNGTDHAVEPPFDKYEESILQGDLSFKSPDPTLVYLGRLKRYKRIDVLLELLAPLLRARKRLRLLVLGQGDDQHRLEALSKSLGIDAQIRFEGFVDEHTKMELLASAWLAVTASDVEGWGIATMEAAAMGCPTVALSSSGIQEAVVSDETGFVCTDTAEFMARCAQLLDDEVLRSAMAQDAARRALSFTWKDSARKTLDILTKEIDAHRGRSSESVGSSL
jgi:glycosyltransferase involved in cell wall biosynthesis